MYCNCATHVLLGRWDGHYHNDDYVVLMFTHSLDDLIMCVWAVTYGGYLLYLTGLEVGIRKTFQLIEERPT